MNRIVEIFFKFKAINKLGFFFEHVLVHVGTYNFVCVIFLCVIRLFACEELFPDSTATL